MVVVDAVEEEDLCKETVPMTAKVVGIGLYDALEAKVKNREPNRMDVVVGEEVVNNLFAASMQGCLHPASRVSARHMPCTICQVSAFQSPF